MGRASWYVASRTPAWPPTSACSPTCSGTTSAAQCRPRQACPWTQGGGDRLVGTMRGVRRCQRRARSSGRTPRTSTSRFADVGHPRDSPRGVNATARLRQVELGHDQSPLSASLARTVERWLHPRSRDGHSATNTRAQHERHPVCPVARTPVAGDLGLTVRPTVHRDHHEVEPVAIAPTRPLVQLSALSARNGRPGRRCVTSSHEAPALPMGGKDSFTEGILQLPLPRVIWFASRCSCGGNPTARAEAAQVRGVPHAPRHQETEPAATTPRCRAPAPGLPDHRGIPCLR